VAHLTLGQVGGGMITINCKITIFANLALKTFLWSTPLEEWMTKVKKEKEKYMNIEVESQTRVKQQIAKMQERRVSNLLTEVDFNEHYVHLADMIAKPTDKYKTNQGRGSTKNLLSTSIEFSGNTYRPSQRFWNSFCAKVGVGTNVFNLFTHDEVYNRVVQDSKFSTNGNVRILEDAKTKTLLAITDPAKPIINWQSLLNLINQKEGYGVAYHNGIITSMHSLSADLPVKVGSEDFSQRIAVHTPIDGYGAPSVYLALLRQVCDNGMVAMSKAFKTTVNIGKKDSGSDIEYSLERMFDSFSNDEGFDALIRRLDAARKAKLSVREFESVQQIIASIPCKERKADGDLKISPELRRFSNMAGSLHAKYGLSHLQQMTEKQMALLDTEMSVYEAINFITEVTTHRLNPSNTKHNGIVMKLNSWVGSLIARPFDLEGTIDEQNVQQEFRDLYFADSLPLRN
jgi:hypothetical protein